MSLPEKFAPRPRVSDIFGAEAAQREHEVQTQWASLLADALNAVRENASLEEPRRSAARLLGMLRRHAEAILLLAEGVRRGASADFWHIYSELLAECNRTEEAIASDRAAQVAFPDDLRFQFREALQLPVVYESQAEIGEYRQRYQAGLLKLKATVRLDTVRSRRAALAALGNHANLFLAYQGFNDRWLQMEYGELACQIVAANYPQWACHLKMPPAPDTEPLRIGYVSSRFYDVSASRFFLGWLRGHDRSRFSIHAWHVGPKTDIVTGEVRGLCSTFHHCPDALEEACGSIRDLDLHALVFLDIGMDPLMTLLASLRLAPLQCMAWDHPVTSGLPTIDYALSSALTEPEGAEDHYSEQLVRLPGVGVCYERPLIPEPLLRKTRGDFGLREDSVVFLCCQSVFKFLPQNDEVLAQIALRVPNAQFVFTLKNEMAGADFIDRLTRSFAAVGVVAEGRIVTLPQLTHFDYWNLHLVGDIFLDTIGWSSGGSVFEAIACRVPVVTLPGDLMRGRQGSAILTQLGVAETIACDEAGYVEIACRLAYDLHFRAHVAAQMIYGYSSLYSDTRSIEALEMFFEREIKAPACR